MTRRGWISIVVMAGVLLHALALVRHNTIMLSANLERAALVADLHVLCNPSGTGTIDQANLPEVPRPTDAQHDCPVCAGLAFVAALPSPVAVPHYLIFDPPSLRPTNEREPPAYLRARHPPVRGPPSLV